MKRVHEVDIPLLLLLYHHPLRRRLHGNGAAGGKVAAAAMQQEVVVRPYVRSKSPRLRGDAEDGSADYGCEGLTISHVKSHLRRSSGVVAKRNAQLGLYNGQRDYHCSQRQLITWIMALMIMITSFPRGEEEQGDKAHHYVAQKACLGRRRRRMKKAQCCPVSGLVGWD
ncbi:unnamed protein product [Linum tenue]|uniref:Uncharacterized protein n=1 Tax=Linum tenue TaxID=586396 RepID=A0AAV0Q4Q8_9ROSI|nr:unnamed protein product [Linum tenue]